MTPEDVFMADIREHPDDNAPRLILADWLEDRGQPGDADRAEFIRIQCRRADLQPGEVEERGLRQRAEHLLCAHWQEWVRPLSKLVGGSHTDGWLRGGYQPNALDNFRRGFVSMLDMPARRFLDYAVEIFHWAPLREVRLHGAGAVARELSACPQLLWLERIDFIDFYSNPVDAVGMEALAGSPYLGALRILGLYRNNLGDAGLAALAGANWLPGLSMLGLDDNGLSEQGMRALAQTQRLFRPQLLALRSNPIGDQGVAALADSPIVSRLGCLQLSHCNLGMEAAHVLAHSPHLSRLRYLNLDGNMLRDSGAYALAHAPWLRRLTTLNVNDCDISDEARQRLFEAMRTP